MIAPHGQLRVYVATRPVDFRKGMDGLALAVQEMMGLDPFCGAAFVFRAKRADRINILIWDRTGMVPVHIPRSSKLAEDIRYALGIWPGRPRFLEDGRLELDTNPVENQIRPIALTRKNALFAGHEVGAENWAILTSLIATCKMSDVKPIDYIAQTLRAILDGHPRSRIEALMHWCFDRPSSLAA